MKTKLFLFLSALTLSLSSCETENNADDVVNAKQNVQANSTTNDLPDVSPCVTTDLLAAKRYDAGEINVFFDSEKVYVQYEAGGNWQIKKTRLYIGKTQLIPVNRMGEPTPELFPMGETNTGNAQTLVYAISRAELPKCFSISAQAEVCRLDENGVLQVETAWNHGVRFTQTDWAMYFSVCQENCAN
jgi:hypothetical protein